MENALSSGRVIGGVDTHKDLHVAAVVDAYDRVLDSQHTSPLPDKAIKLC